MALKYSFDQTGIIEVPTGVVEVNERYEGKREGLFPLIRDASVQQLCSGGVESLFPLQSVVRLIRTSLITVRHFTVCSLSSETGILFGIWLCYKMSDPKLNQDIFFDILIFFLFFFLPSTCSLHINRSKWNTQTGLGIIEIRFMLIYSSNILLNLPFLWNNISGIHHKETFKFALPFAFSYIWWYIWLCCRSFHVETGSAHPSAFSCDYMEF